MAPINGVAGPHSPTSSAPDEFLIYRDLKREIQSALAYLRLRRDLVLPGVELIESDFGFLFQVLEEAHVSDLRDPLTREKIFLVYAMAHRDDGTLRRVNSISSERALINLKRLHESIGHRESKDWGVVKHSIYKDLSYWIAHLKQPVVVVTPASASRFEKEPSPYDIYRELTSPVSTQRPQRSIGHLKLVAPSPKKLPAPIVLGEMPVVAGQEEVWTQARDSSQSATPPGEDMMKKLLLHVTSRARLLPEGDPRRLVMETVLEISRSMDTIRRNEEFVRRQFTIDVEGMPYTPDDCFDLTLRKMNRLTDLLMALDKDVTIVTPELLEEVMKLLAVAVPYLDVLLGEKERTEMDELRQSLRLLKLKPQKPAPIRLGLSILLGMVAVEEGLRGGSLIYGKLKTNVQHDLNNALIALNAPDVGKGGWMTVDGSFASFEEAFKSVGVVIDPPFKKRLDESRTWLRARVSSPVNLPQAPLTDQAEVTPGRLSRLLQGIGELKGDLFRTGSGKNTPQSLLRTVPSDRAIPTFRHSLRLIDYLQSRGWHHLIADARRLGNPRLGNLGSSMRHHLNHPGRLRHFLQGAMQSISYSPIHLPLARFSTLKPLIGMAAQAR